MKKKYALVSLTLGLLLTACGILEMTPETVQPLEEDKGGLPAQSLYGRWHDDRLGTQGTCTQSIDVEFMPQRANFYARCVCTDGVVVDVTTAVPAAYSANRIAYLGHSSNNNSAGGHPCSITIREITFGYSLQRNVLKLNDGKSPAFILHR